MNSNEVLVEEIPEGGDTSDVDRLVRLDLSKLEELALGWK
jgi:hypothetical protein